MGRLLDNTGTRQLMQSDLQRYASLRQELAQLPVPLLQDRSDIHDHLFIALFDGTGHDSDDKRQRSSNIGEMAGQLRAKAPELAGERIRWDYASGIGTQPFAPARALDGVHPFSWDERIEKMYQSLTRFSADWKRRDPEAQVRVIAVGYSRGAVLVPGFARLVDTYGIAADPEELRFGRDRHGAITVETGLPRLAEPGTVAQAVGLFDPVATGMPRHYDARLPPSVLSGVSLLAADEQRRWFPHQLIIGQQVSADGRFLGATVPGGHADVGGGNAATGLEVQAFNHMVDYLNTLSDQRLFTHRPVPGDARAYVVHQQRGVTAGWGLAMDRDGQRNLRHALADCTVVDICGASEPVNQRLAARFTYRHPRVQDVALRPELPAHALAPVPMNDVERALLPDVSVSLPWHAPESPTRGRAR
ncbi:DUF2235 domain-containing protein [Stenotrophomonas sp. C3(2023)]|uniref:phospholipase effector Tle1 domain-containing protein n=1 Tax=Stenotrophomonas sp. C3(2023) TaxID=3080277 RepID=UPI00293CB764|nr:DUF2235 domain-containing protein [Stenotrophomonas sp. C3(2023)]MDV3467921.1 DUF2235 domain-containing protein [Stenotrophomonas sp. C3(2023)]